MHGSPVITIGKKTVEVPGELQITKIQANQLPSNVGYEAVIKRIPPKGAVLMLPQQTQTENRSFIKHLLTLINEAIMRQLEDKAQFMD